MSSNPFPHITFDLEALGKPPNPPIVQIAAVKFNETGDYDENIFSRNIKLESLQKYNFDVDYETLSWWFNRDHEAIKLVFCQPDVVPLRQALFEFLEWIGKHGDYQYWSHSTFDPPVLMANLKEVGLKNRIPFRLFKDIRTLTFLSKIDTKDSTPRTGTHHNALDDCLHQVKYISKNLQHNLS